MDARLVKFKPRRTWGGRGFVGTWLGFGDVRYRGVGVVGCVGTVRRALETGMNVIDTAPFYEDGLSEEIVGRALREGGFVGRNREKVFVIDKVDALAEPVGPQVEGSLGRLGMERVDLLVMHGLSEMEGAEGWKAAAGEGGSMRQLGEMIAAGKARFRGISSHDPEVLAAAIPSGLVDVVMFPIGPFVDERYVMEILPLARRCGVGTVCFKTFGAGKLLGDTEGYQVPLAQRPRGKVSSGGSDGGEATLPRMGVEECLHYTMTVDPDVVLLGLSFANEQDAAWEAFSTFRGPLDGRRMGEIRERAKEAIAGKGKVWWNPG